MFNISIDLNVNVELLIKNILLYDDYISCFFTLPDPFVQHKNATIFFFLWNTYEKNSKIIFFLLLSQQLSLFTYQVEKDNIRID